MKKLLLAFDGEPSRNHCENLPDSDSARRRANRAKEGGAAHECQSKRRIEKMRATFRKSDSRSRSFQPAPPT